MATALNASSPLVYDPRFHTFESWACLMCEQYSTQQLQIPDQNTNWQDWAVGVKAIDLFNNQAIPSPYDFAEWQNWAEALVNVMNGGR